MSAFYGPPNKLIRRHPAIFRQSQTLGGWVREWKKWIGWEIIDGGLEIPPGWGGVSKISLKPRCLRIVGIKWAGSNEEKRSLHSQFLTQTTQPRLLHQAKKAAKQTTFTSESNISSGHCCGFSSQAVRKLHQDQQRGWGQKHYLRATCGYTKTAASAPSCVGTPFSNAGGGGKTWTLKNRDTKHCKTTKKAKKNASWIKDSFGSSPRVVNLFAGEE